ncbi:flagellar basal body-associated protein FliL [Ruegeria sp. AD91A]|uniref:flagellar basal body-associated protein FliL n=1 Tax=Ruegeria sp. AD91A TaxID=2293862 RepID=UPI000E47BC65|nr:flagellar basal body-associated protein FliL [Ruegeria sp. AD91A]AXT27579.1 flagellar basal body-associated protein FliL [Ruegeria sp. AD91A]
MIAKLIPVFFLIVGLGAGIGAGLVLAPAKNPESAASAKEAVKEVKAVDKKSGKSKKKDKGDGFGYLKMTKQFVVPVVKDDQIEAMVALSLSLEANPAITETYYAIEPKLRDGFLQVLFDHANMGGFDGAFTESGNLDVLRNSLLEVARKEFGEDVSKVLILSVNRQDS